MAYTKLSQREVLEVIKVAYELSQREVLEVIKMAYEFLRLLKWHIS